VKSVNATAYMGANDDSKRGKEKEKGGNRNLPHMWSPPTFYFWLRLRSTTNKVWFGYGTRVMLGVEIMGLSQ